MSWQPIETAPKDGTWFLANPVGNETLIVRWVKKMIQEFVPIEGGLYERKERDAGHFETGRGFFSSNVHPKYWQSLPTPPFPEGEEQENE